MEMQESGSALKTKMDDHALEQVPESERKSWIQLSNNAMGICSTLLIMFFGVLATFTAGLLWGMVAGIICLTIGTIFGTLLGNMARKDGLSSTVLSRRYGFGVRGSVVSSLVFCFMILGMLALENVLLYHGILFFFGMEPVYLKCHRYLRHFYAVLGIPFSFWNKFNLPCCVRCDCWFSHYFSIYDF